MKKFIANKVDNGSIELKYNKDLEDLYNTIEEGDNFILEWKENNTLNSKLIMGTDLISKIKTGDMVLSSIETMDNL